MKWTTPDFEEISLNCEINCYCSAIDIDPTELGVGESMIGSRWMPAMQRILDPFP